MGIRHQTHPDEFATLDTAGPPTRFLVGEPHTPGELRLVPRHRDRLVVDGRWLTR